MANRNTLLGIDLGTSYSSAAYLDERGYARSIPNSDGEPATPSVVYFSADGPIVGARAVKAYVRHPSRVVFHPKRVLGDKATTWEFDDVEYTPVDISAIILRKLLRDARKHVGHVNQAVMTVPVHFTSYQRQLTIEAADQAGVKVLEVLNEPVAAALCFILGEEGTGFAALAKEQRVLVYDLGGGTFDLSLVDYKADNIRVLAANGDLKLGGLDWNQRIVDVVVKQVLRKKQIDPRDPENRSMFAQLSMAVESAKRKMSETTDSVPIAFRDQEFRFVARLSRREFERMTTDLLDRTRVLLEQIVKSAPRRIGAKGPGGWSDVDSMIIVGGASRMPMVHKMMQQLVKGEKLIKPVDPEMSVSHGAALYAGLLSANRKAGTQAAADSRLTGMEMQNVTGLSLGIIVVDDKGQRVVHPVIRRNSPLPAVAHVDVATTRPSQRRVSLKITEVEGSGEIYRCVLDNLPRGLPAGSEIDVDLCYDESGVIHIVGRHRASGQLASVSMECSRGESTRGEGD